MKKEAQVGESVIIPLNWGLSGNAALKPLGIAMNAQRLIERQTGVTRMPMFSPCGAQSA